MLEHERPVIDWEPVGTAGRARLTARAPSGEAADIDTIDLGRASDRAGYARRVAAMFPGMPQHAAEHELLRIAEERLGMRTDPPPTPMTLSAALDAWESTPDTPRIVTGFRPLDELAGGGLPCGTMTVLAGRPGAGKSALALQACIGSMLADPSVSVLWGLGEMSPEALACRAVAVGSVLMGRDPVTMPRAGRRAKSAREVAGELRHDLGGRLHIVAPLTLDRIEAGVKATGARLVVIDYLQLVRVDGAADRRQEVDSVVKALRELTLAHGLALVAVSNIARSVGRDTRAGGVGKESSEIDFAADLLLLGDPADVDDEHGGRPVQWRCLKNRHGRPGDIEATFDGSLQVFTAPEAEPFPEFVAFTTGGRP
ncbi:MAG: DnaB-like helicase C-terminal domain-containing protein [Planctomycetia bacterium]